MNWNNRSLLPKIDLMCRAGEWKLLASSRLKQKRKTQIFYNRSIHVEKLKLFILSARQNESKEGSRGNFEKLTSAWKLTSKISSRFQQKIHFRLCMEEVSGKTFSLTLFLIFLWRWSDEHLQRQKFFLYLIIQSMFYKKLLLFFSYARRIMFVFDENYSSGWIFTPAESERRRWEI